MTTTSAKFLQEYKKLNPEQRLAVDTIDGPVLVVAGPGSGKTQLLSMRVANILQKTDISAKNILCLTFTDSAANNMKQRLYSIIGREAYRVSVHTFHSFGTEIINHNPEHFFIGANFQPADDLAKIGILEEILDGLEYNNPLNSRHQDHGWTFLNDIQNRISNLKQGGISPEDFNFILEENFAFAEKYNSVFSDFFSNLNMRSLKQADFENFIEDSRRVITDFLEKSPELFDIKLGKLRKISAIYQSLAFLVSQSLENLHAELQNLPKFSSKLVTAWRDKFGKRDGQNKFKLLQLINHPKYTAFSEIYAKYQNLLHKKSLYDFDDMLLEVVKSFQNVDELKFNYQEKFLYILVDEFQDTNGVQTALIDQLINMEVTEGRPNILAVGDDDQAIFKFQGASIANILSFKEKYKGVKVINLTKNYRSKQAILNLAMEVIKFSQKRLTELPEVDKNLVSMVQS